MKTTTDKLTEFYNKPYIISVSHDFDLHRKPILNLVIDGRNVDYDELKDFMNTLEETRLDYEVSVVWKRIRSNRF